MALQLTHSVILTPGVDLIRSVEFIRSNINQVVDVVDAKGMKQQKKLQRGTITSQSRFVLSVHAIIAEVMCAHGAQHIRTCHKFDR